MFFIKKTYIHFYYVYLSFLFFFFYTLQNSNNSKFTQTKALTSSKLQKRPPPKTQNCRRAFWGHFDTWRRGDLTHLRHWRRVGSRAAANEDQQPGGSGSSPSSLPVRTGSASPSHLHKKQKHTNTTHGS